ncbi:MAG: molybdopterin-dependent oxidoreductase, partial [Chloroflexi bacterium]|nr:molybdopterin-dependent oxidoreductase [Chloroflexota bacterium]
MALSDWLERRKQREARKKALADRIPPGQELTDKWPVLHYGVIPPFDPYQWDFTVKGLVKGDGLRLSYREFMALPRVTVEADMHCVTGWSKLDNLWEGVAFREILRRVSLQPHAKYVTVFCDGGYTTNLPLDVLMDDDVLFAFRHNGENLTPEHGWPLRLVVPRLYFWKSAKWA